MAMYLFYFHSLAAKNLILAGPKSVALFDNAPVSMEDLGCNVSILV
jgi:hypothetical protein